MSGGFDLKIGGVEGFQGGFQTPPVFLPGKSEGWRGVLEGCFSLESQLMYHINRLTSVPNHGVMFLFFSVFEK